MELPTITLNEPNIKQYRLMGYYMGGWWTICKVYAESDNEAIFDADESYNANTNPNDWDYPVALWCGNRIVKKYNNNSIC